MKAQRFIGLLGLARELRLPAEWLRREADARRLPCLRVGRRRMFDPEEVSRELAKRQEVEVVRG